MLFFITLPPVAAFIVPSSYAFFVLVASVDLMLAESWQRRRLPEGVAFAAAGMV